MICQQCPSAIRSTQDDMVLCPVVTTWRNVWWGCAFTAQQVRLTGREELESVVEMLEAENDLR